MAKKKGGQGSKRAPSTASAGRDHLPEGYEGGMSRGRAPASDIRPKDMRMHHASDGKGGKDSAAHPSHDAANSAFGMPDGAAPKPGYHDHGHGYGEGMEDNVCYED